TPYFPGLLVKNLVKMHNGTVEARSNGVGKGSEFIVRLPRVHGHASAEIAPKDVRPREAAAPSGNRLLVVDDNKDAANTLAMLLRLQGHEVQVAFSGVAALEIAKAFHPHLVFLDIGMPDMDGYEVARRLRNETWGRNSVLVALTGWGQHDDRRRSAEAGFNHHLVKPPEFSSLSEILTNLNSNGN
ncbi:MAG TPA: response regulator, partial [Terriglobales bacterium]|nr:response regulator [Terriglobales bacterium]